MSEEQAAELDGEHEERLFLGDRAFPSYALSNNNQNIKRIEGRIQQLERAQETGYRGWDFEGGTVVPNQKENRLQIFFEEIPRGIASGVEPPGLPLVPAQPGMRQLNP